MPHLQQQNVDISGTFTTSPLITTERLARDVGESLRITPAWATFHKLADDEDSADFSVVVILAGERYPHQFHLYAVSFAILLELTRYGNSVTTNTNKKAGDKEASYFLKMIYAGASKDNTPVSRIIEDAGPDESITPLKEDRRELRASVLKRSPARKLSKDARLVAMRHAETRVRAHGNSQEDEAAYLANLRMLFTYHDELFGVDSGLRLT